jgi:hypothetical protein
MERFLILLAIVLASVAVCTAGRYRYPIKEGADHFFERLQLAGNVVAIGVELLLPAVTGFLGQPLLAYAAATL